MTFMVRFEDYTHPTRQNVLRLVAGDSNPQTLQPLLLIVASLNLPA
jgi:hypothetical protein